MNVTAPLKTLANLLAGNGRSEGGRRVVTEGWRDEKGEPEEEKS